MGNNNFKFIKIQCPHCEAGFTKSVAKNYPPELGKVIFCPRCHQKLLWWNDHLLTIHEIPEPFSKTSFEDVKEVLIDEHTCITERSGCA
jgi:hypothetical protein